MDWIVHTPALRHLHMGLAASSGLLFALRGASTLRGMRWPQHALVRRLSVVIDSGLLAAALRLLWSLHLNPLVTPWLQAKLLALLLYIGLGVLTFRLRRQGTLRALAFTGALLCFAYIVSVALTHSPWGVLSVISRR